MSDQQEQTEAADGQSELTGVLGTDFDQMATDELHDSGHWTVSADGREIASDDFTHDVVLRVTGDFYSDEQRKAYAENLAAKLNVPNVKSEGRGPKEQK